MLKQASTGEVSLADAARALGLPDGGHVLRAIANAGLLLPVLSSEEVARQLAAGATALEQCEVHK